MNTDDSTSQQKRPARGPSTGLLVVVFGLVEVGIIYALIALDTPVSDWARRAAETWPGRIILASIGWGVICVGMITVLTIVERRQARADQDRVG